MRRMFSTEALRSGNAASISVPAPMPHLLASNYLQAGPHAAHSPAVTPSTATPGSAFSTASSASASSSSAGPSSSSYISVPPSHHHTLSTRTLQREQLAMMRTVSEDSPWRSQQQRERSQSNAAVGRPSASGASSSSAAGFSSRAVGAKAGRSTSAASSTGQPFFHDRSRDRTGGGGDDDDDDDASSIRSFTCASATEFDRLADAVPLPAHLLAPSSNYSSSEKEQQHQQPQSSQQPLSARASQFKQSWLDGVFNKLANRGSNPNSSKKKRNSTEDEATNEANALLRKQHFLDLSSIISPMPSAAPVAVASTTSVAVTGPQANLAAVTPAAGASSGVLAQSSPVRPAVAHNFFSADVVPTMRSLSIDHASGASASSLQRQPAGVRRPSNNASRPDLRELNLAQHILQRKTSDRERNKAAAQSPTASSAASPVSRTQQPPPMTTTSRPVLMERKSSNGRSPEAMQQHSSSPIKIPASQVRVVKEQSHGTTMARSPSDSSASSGGPRQTPGARGLTMARAASDDGKGQLQRQHFQISSIPPAPETPTVPGTYHMPGGSIDESTRDSVGSFYTDSSSSPKTPTSATLSKRQLYGNSAEMMMDSSAFPSHPPPFGSGSFHDAAAAGAAGIGAHMTGSALLLTGMGGDEKEHMLHDYNSGTPSSSAHRARQTHRRCTASPDPSE